MRHCILTGDFGQCDQMLAKILAAHGKYIKSVSACNSCAVMENTQPKLQVLGPSQSPVTFVNISTITIIYQLPENAEMDIKPFIPDAATGAVN